MIDSTDLELLRGIYLDGDPFRNLKSLITSKAIEFLHFESSSLHKAVSMVLRYSNYIFLSLFLFTNTIFAGDCAGEKNSDASDILEIPLQPGAMDILASEGSINDGHGQSFIYPKDSLTWCGCRDGQFCCGSDSTVPGGESAIQYFKDVKATCDGKAT